MIFNGIAEPRGRVNLDISQLMAGLGHVWDSDRQVITEFERRFAGYIGTEHAIAVGSAKAGLVMLLKAMGARPGQGVIVSGYNVPEVPAVLRAMGLRVLAADIDRDTYNLDPKQVEILAEQADFLIITHLYGNPADLDTLTDVAKRHNLAVIEDCAQSLGARYRGKRLGSHGNPAIFSFGMMKNLTALGGGMVTVNDGPLAEKIRSHRASGQSVSGMDVLKSMAKGGAIAMGTGRAFPLFFKVLRGVETLAPDLMYRVMKGRPDQWEQGKIDLSGLTLKMHPAQAATGLKGLGRVDRDTDLRVKNAEILLDALAGVRGVGLPETVDGSSPGWTNFVVRVDNRGSVKRRMLYCGFDTTWGYLSAIDRIADQGECPNARVLEKTNLYLPVWSKRRSVTERMAQCLIRAVAESTGER